MSPTPEPTGGPLDRAAGVDLGEVTPDRAVGTLPVAGNTQPYGLLHGGASALLAEALALAAARAHAGGAAAARVVELSASHHAAARAGTVTGTASAVRRGRTLATYAVAVTDDAGRRLCTARVTCALGPPPA